MYGLTGVLRKGSIPLLPYRPFGLKIIEGELDMVRIAEFKEKGKDAVTSSLFLSSINSWHKDDGVEMVVNRIGKYMCYAILKRLSF